MSNKDVRQVSEAAREIAQVGKRAQQIKVDLGSAIAEVNDALSIAEDVTRALKSASAELRAVLGGQTNNPPEDSEGGKS